MNGRTALSLLLAWVMGAGAVRAQDSAGLPPKDGERVRLTLREGHPPRLVGTVLASDEHGLTLWTKKQGSVVVPVRQIQTIEVSVRPKRVGRNALIGAGIGVVVGLVWGGIEQGRCEARGGWFCGLAVPGAMILATPSGALVGAATGAERWEERRLEGGRVGIGPRRGGVGFSVSFGF